MNRIREIRWKEKWLFVLIFLLINSWGCVSLTLSPRRLGGEEMPMKVYEIENEKIRLVVQTVPSIKFIFAAVDGKGVWKEVAISSLSELIRIRTIPSEKIQEVSFRKEDGSLIIKAKVNSHLLEVKVTLLPEEEIFQVVSVLELTETEKVEYFQSLLRFCTPLIDFCWVPTLRPEDDMVIGDHVFRSPALVLQKGPYFAALVPDLDLLRDNRQIKTCLEFDLGVGSEAESKDDRSRQGNTGLEVRSGQAASLEKEKGSEEGVFLEESALPVFGYGFKDYQVTGHTYYRHDSSMVAKLSPQKLVFGYYLFIDAQSPEKMGYRRILRFLWKKYASYYLTKVAPQTLPFPKYVDYVYPAVEKIGEYVEFEINREEVAGIKAVGKHSTYFRIPENIVWNQAWFNNLRTAYGWYYYGKVLNRKDWQEKAKKIKEWSLKAPQEQGIFPEIFDLDTCSWWGSVPRLNGGENRYHTASASWTAYWMLRWYQDLEQDERLLHYAREYGNFLVGHQLPSGAIPGWFEMFTLEPVETLKESAQTAASTYFLAELCAITGDPLYMEALRKGCDFLIREVIPDMKYFDYETFFSCSWKPIGMRDPHTGLYAHNNYSMYWTAHSLLQTYRHTGDKKYLDYGLAVLDLLSFYQQVWNPPYLSLYAFGGFGVMNTDGEWNDSRQAVFAWTYLDAYRITGIREYFERGIAALRASFVLLAIPENREVSPYTYDAYPQGLSPENFAHAGVDKTHGRSDCGWGEGGALASSALVERYFGSIYLDAIRNDAFGIDGCQVQEISIEDNRINLRLEMLLPRKQAFLVIKGDHLEKEEYFLNIPEIFNSPVRREILEEGLKIYLSE